MIDINDQTIMKKKLSNIFKIKDLKLYTKEYMFMFFKNQQIPVNIFKINKIAKVKFLKQTKISFNKEP